MYILIGFLSIGYLYLQLQRDASDHRPKREILYKIMTTVSYISYVYTLFMINFSSINRRLGTKEKYHHLL